MAGKAGLLALGVLAGLLCGVQAPRAAISRASPLTMTSTTDHALIHQALLTIRQRHWSQAQAVMTHAHDPLGAKLYNWLYYTEGGGAVQFNQIAGFIRQNPDWPRQNKLLVAAEKALPLNLPQADVVDWFSEHMPETSEGMDRYLQALIQTGSAGTAGQVLRDWWKTANLEPEQQTYFLQHYSNLLDHEAQVRRLNVLLTRGEYVEARVIAHQLLGGYEYLADAREAFASNRPDAYQYLDRVPAPLQREPALLLDQLRWRLRQGNDFAALDILHNMPPADTLPDPDAWWLQRNILIRHLIANHQYDSAYFLASDSGLKDGPSYADAEFMAGWLALRFLNKPWDGFLHFEALYKSTTSPISRARGAYWAGRASDALGYADTARQWYQAAAIHQTTFYGQLAISALKDQFRPPQQQPPEKTIAGKQAFDRKEMVRAAHLLNEAGMTDETTDMLETLAADVKTPEDYRLTAELAEDLGHPQNAVKIAKKGLNKGILLMDQLYPTILSHMRHVPIEWALAHALIRQESAFDFRAQSGAGALGLMQVMPATAQGVAQRNHIGYRPDLLVNDPDYNIEIGSLYFKQLLDKYNNSYPLALAAYNGGPGRVDGWLQQFGDPRTGQVGIADWIELIPVAETRNYVQRVLEAVYIYRLKLKGVQKSYLSSAGTQTADHL